MSQKTIVSIHLTHPVKDGQHEQEVVEHPLYPLPGEGDDWAAVAYQAHQAHHHDEEALGGPQECVHLGAGAHFHSRNPTVRFGEESLPLFFLTTWMFLAESPLDRFEVHHEGCFSSVFRVDSTQFKGENNLPSFHFTQ